MNRARKLVLRRETLAELTGDDLQAVFGGNSRETCNCPDYTYYCITGPAICDTLLCP